MSICDGWYANRGLITRRKTRVRTTLGVYMLYLLRLTFLAKFCHDVIDIVLEIVLDIMLYIDM